MTEPLAAVLHRFGRRVGTRAAPSDVFMKSVFVADGGFGTQLSNA